MGALGTRLRGAPRPPLTAGPRAPARAGSPTEHWAHRRGSNPCPEEQSHCAVFKTEMELLEPAFQGAGEIPALPEAGCSVPEGQRVLRRERQLSSKSELRITQLGLPKTPRNLTHTTISVLGQRSSASRARACRVTAVLIRDVSKFNWKTAAPPRSQRNMDSQQIPRSSRCALAMTNVNA